MRKVVAAEFMTEDGVMQDPGTWARSSSAAGLQAAELRCQPGWKWERRGDDGTHDDTQIVLAQ